MNIKSSKIEGLYISESKIVIDERGSFERLFCKDSISKWLGDSEILQVNQSVNNYAGTLRGMHLQLNQASEKKIVRCLSGEVYDVIIDLRTGSNTFLQWESIVLSPEKSNIVLIPEGCAHGFQTLKDNSSLLYLHSENYSPLYEVGYHYLDPLFNIKWPRVASNISDKDKEHAFLTSTFLGH